MKGTFPMLVSILCRQIYEYVNENKELVSLKGSLFILDNGKRILIPYGTWKEIVIPDNVSLISY